MPSSPFSHNDSSADSIKEGFSSTRMQKYLYFAANDIEKALELHAYNSFLGASLHPPIQTFELFLRNSCDRQLTELYQRDDWFDAFPHFDEFAFLIDEINATKKRLRALRRDPNHPPCVIADLSFGFWAGLFVARLDRVLYSKGLDKVFPLRPTGMQRARLHDGLDKLRTLRNRVAHHEPLFHRNLPKAHGLIVKLAGFISSDSANWIKHHSQFETAWENIPELNPDAKRILDQARNRDNNFDVLN